MARFAQTLHKVIHYLSRDFLGGPRYLRFNWVINFQKGMTLFWVYWLMWYFDNFSIQAWVYLALHGSYGLIWIIKDQLFPDKRWQESITFGGAFMAIALVLAPYWVAAYLLISPVLGLDHFGASPPWLSISVFMYAMGLYLMLVTDAQKFFTLKITKRLITDGMFRTVRHANYLGEMLIYSSFAIVAWHWAPWVILAWVWLGYFSVNIYMIELSLSRYEDWADYKKRSWCLIPYVF
jgi:protein-S-isoprenylcysteine O-methyltransferase Ste14